MPAGSERTAVHSAHHRHVPPQSRKSKFLVGVLQATWYLAARTTARHTVPLLPSTSAFCWVLASLAPAMRVPEPWPPAERMQQSFQPQARLAARIRLSAFGTPDCYAAPLQRPCGRPPNGAGGLMRAPCGAAAAVGPPCFAVAAAAASGPLACAAEAMRAQSLSLLSQHAVWLPLATGSASGPPRLPSPAPTYLVPAIVSVHGQCVPDCCVPVSRHYWATF